MTYHTLAISQPNELTFGRVVYPVTTPRGLVIGGGTVYPELNFTLPPMSITPDTREEVLTHYREIISSALERAAALYQEGVVFEFETLPEMTLDPSLGIEIVSILNEACEQYHQSHGIRGEIRLTPNDLRELGKPLRMRSGKYLDLILTLFEGGAQAGGNLLSIESTGGKELSDHAIMNCDISASLYSLSVLGVRDVKFLWEHITRIARSTGTISGGDTACGFGNTAMVLADKRYIPRVFAAIVRILTVVRTLAAVEAGAQGPDKDCGYEGPYLKAIAGIPISMEGRSSACAHFSPVGNIAGACCDLWSNESVSNVRLLSGMAPTVSMEQLIYDTRLYHAASQLGSRDAYVRMLVESDVHRDPQALVLAPEHVIDIAGHIVQGKNAVDASVRGALRGLDIIEAHVHDGSLTLDAREEAWIPLIREKLEEVPRDEDEFTDSMLPLLEEQGIDLGEYGL